MSSITVSVIIAAAVLIVGGLLRPVWEHLLFKVRSRHAKIPDLKGRWNGQWYVEDSEEGSRLYIEDTIDIEKQRGLKVFGKGKDPKKGTYLLTGKLDMSNIVCFSYEFESPLNSLRGGVILKIGPEWKTCEGRWYGYTKEDVIQGGKVFWKRT